MSSAVLRRSAVAEAGGIPDTIQIVPDYYLYVAIARRYRARAIQEVVCRYRLHAGSMSSSPPNRLRLHEEPLSIVKQWSSCLDPRLSAYRQMTYSTYLALEEMRSPRTAFAGMKRLLAGWLGPVADLAPVCQDLACDSATVTAALLAKAKTQ